MGARIFGLGSYPPPRLSRSESEKHEPKKKQTPPESPIWEWKLHKNVDKSSRLVCMSNSVHACNLSKTEHNQSSYLMEGDVAAFPLTPPSRGGGGVAAASPDFPQLNLVGSPKKLRGEWSSCFAGLGIHSHIHWTYFIKHIFFEF